MSIALQKITKKEALATIQMMIESGNILENINVALGETIFKLNKDKKTTEFIFFGNNNNNVLMKTYFEKEAIKNSHTCKEKCEELDDSFCKKYRVILDWLTDNNKEKKYIRCQGCVLENKK